MAQRVCVWGLSALACVVCVCVMCETERETHTEGAREINQCDQSIIIAGPGVIITAEFECVHVRVHQCDFVCVCLHECLPVYLCVQVQVHV